jgi:hypothetical protein
VRYFYNAQLIETTQDAKVVFYQSQFSCHNAKVVLADRGDNGQVLIGQSPQHRHTFPHRGFLHWRLSDDGPGASRIVVMGRHPKPFTEKPNSPASALFGWGEKSDLPIFVLLASAPS